jgi:NAD(P)H-dependent FMN reductase
LLRIGLIIGSTRPNRFADIPAQWIQDGARAVGAMSLEVLDLREQHLPFYDEPVLQLYTGGAYKSIEAEAWRKKIAELDGYIVTVAEYNHSMTAVLKNAFDSAYYEWNRKPIAFVGYGGVGAARAIEQLRCVCIELHMAPVKPEVNIAMEPVLGITRAGKSLNDYSYLNDARSLMFEHIIWWGEALKHARDTMKAPSFLPWGEKETDEIAGVSR